jgi:hypothetical protein
MQQAKRWLITITLIVTFPIWFLPVALGLVVWGIHDAIWNPGPYD